MEVGNTILHRSIIFDLKTPKKEYSLIRMRFTIDSRRVEYYLPGEYKIKPDYWDKISRCAIADSRRNKDLKGDPQLRTNLDNINTEIVRSKNALVDLLQEYQRREIKLTPMQIKNLLAERLGKRVCGQKTVFFLDFVKEYIENNTDLQEASKRSHHSTLSVIETYCEKERKKLRFDDITIDFYNKFNQYLRTTKHDKGDYYKPGTIGRIFKNIRSWMRAAYNLGLTNNKDFMQKAFKVIKDEADTIYLKIDEIEKVYNTDLSASTRLEKVRDVFVIMCCMGVRYSDYLLLKKENITPSGFVRLVTKKTKTPVEIPMHDRVLDIMKRYNGEFPPAPCNQRFNAYINEVIIASGIDREVVITETRGNMTNQKTVKLSDLVTAHTARRSFATNMFLAGVQSLSIMKITGHKTEKEFLRYIRVSQEDNAIKLQNDPFFKVNKIAN